MDDDDRFDVLKNKINDRLVGNREVNNDDLDLYHYICILEKEIDPYNNILIKDVSSFKEKLNNAIIHSNNVNIPLIKNIYPSVNYYIPNHLDFYLIDKSKRLCGSVVLYQGKGYDECISEEYNARDILDFLNNYNKDIKKYFDTLDKFNQKYPDVNYEWGAPCREKIQIVRDDLFKVYLNLDKLDDIELTFANIKDLELQYDNIIMYKELENLLEYHKDSLVKNMYVDIDNFNSLYKSIIINSLKNKNEKKLLLEK